MTSTNELLNYCEQKYIGCWEIIDNKPQFAFNERDIEYLNKDIPIFDGRKGGLVIGKLHVNGGVHLLDPCYKNPKFIYMGEMEGWEYLSSPLKSKKHLSELSEINDRLTGIGSSIPTEFDIPDKCGIIDTKNTSLNVILVNFSIQTIINRQATKEYIDEILRIEEKNNC